MGVNVDIDEIVEAMRRKLLEAIIVCDRIGGREDEKQNLLESLKNLDATKEEYIISKRNLTIENILKNV